MEPLEVGSRLYLYERCNTDGLRITPCIVNRVTSKYAHYNVGTRINSQRGFDKKVPRTFTKSNSLGFYEELDYYYSTSFLYLKNEAIEELYLLQRLRQKILIHLDKLTTTVREMDFEYSKQELLDYTSILDILPIEKTQ